MKTTKKILQLAIALASLVFSITVFGQSNPKLTDAEIASVAVTANQIDINAGKLAKAKSKNPEVKNFATTMISDHQSVISQASALVKKLHVTPKDNAVSRKLQSDAAKTKALLRSKSGKAFDKAYIDNEVSYHQAVISTVESVLITQAQNQELKQLLQNVLPTLRTHLEHAQMVQKNFK